MLRTKNLIDTFIITIAEQRVIHVLSIVKRTYDFSGNGWMWKKKFD